MKAPNGWISHDLLIWNELDRRGFVAAGFVLDVPDLRHASERSDCFTFAKIISIGLRSGL
jgi:hypothetical protein